MSDFFLKLLVLFTVGWVIGIVIGSYFLGGAA